METPKYTKKQRQKEKKACEKRELKQLGAKTGIYPVYLNSTTEPKHISKEREEKEQKTRKWMDLKSIDAIANPEKHKTKGLGNSPVSTFNKLQTEWKCQEDKLPRNYESWHNKNIPQAVRVITVPNPKNNNKPTTDYKIVIKPQILPKKSPSAGIGKVSWQDAEKIRNAIRERQSGNMLDKTGEKQIE